MQVKCVCLPKNIAGKDMTSHPESALKAATINETAIKVNAPVAAGPP